jgi:RNase P/RNase MRP subunit p30
MKVDYLFPQNNESYLLNEAQRLGYKKVFLIYNFSKELDYQKLEKKIENKKKKFSNLIILTGLLAQPKEIQKAKKFTKFIFTDLKDKSPDDVRKTIEIHKPFMIFNLEFQKFDFIHHKNSGLNHITSKLLFENNIRLGFSFSLILFTKNRFFILGRIMQNIKFARKFKFKTAIGSFTNNNNIIRNSSDLESLFIKLGMHPKEASDSFEL